jgi:hypothetical protein
MKQTAYAKRLSTLWAKYGKAATPSQLRNLAKSGLELSTVPFRALSPADKVLRSRALIVKANMRNGMSLGEAARQEQLKPTEVIRQIGRYLFKHNGQWRARQTDTIERSRWFFSNGERISVILTNSRDASLVSKYLATVRHALETGDESLLKPFKRLTIKDADGKKHRFETRLNVLYELEEQRDEDHFDGIYD